MRRQSRRRILSVFGIMRNVMYDKEKFQACVDWFYANRDSLLPLYHGKFVVCADGKVVGAWSSLALAAANAVEMGYAPGTFAVQECVTEEEEARVRIYTPWVDFSRAESVR